MSKFTDIGEVKLILGDMEVLGLRYKNYYIKDLKLKLAEDALKLKTCNVFSHGQLSYIYAESLVSEPLAANISSKLQALMRLYFYENRVEIFKPFFETLDKNNLLAIDYNLLYLSILSAQLPVRGKEVNIKTDDVSIPGFYWTQHKIIGMDYPVLPQIIDDKTYFTAGQGIGLYWYEELLEHKRNGGLLMNTWRVYEFEEEKSFMTPYTNILRGLKNKPLKKILANTLYGRLGIRSWKYKTALRFTNDIEIANDFIKREKNYGKYTLFELNQLSQFTTKKLNIPLALAISSKARLKIYAYLNYLQNNGVCVYAINSDELLVDKHSFLKLNNINMTKNFKKKTLSSKNREELLKLHSLNIYKRNYCYNDNFSKAWVCINNNLS